MSDRDALTLATDVLVIGGGMAAAWAALSAAQAGAEVILVDKGYVGTSGVTATGGPNHWWVAPEPGKRESAVEERYARAFGLADRDWMLRIIEETWRSLPELARYYPFATDGKGGTFYSGVRGPEYMRALRRYAIDSGVVVLDQHPALELLLHADGSVAGASGFARLDRRPWTIRASAVVMATGGCAFRSGLIGSYGNTGDGYLMAVEAGAALSGMEFTMSYSLSPAWNSTRTLPYFAARFFAGNGEELDIPPPARGEAGHQRALAKAMLQGPVLAELADAPEPLKHLLRSIQPASLPPFERRGIDLFRDRFEIKLFGEGTVRGTGGIRIADAHCQTDVVGLYAAGDAATRELIAGATSGGGAQNSAWALTSGRTAGRNAAEVSRRKSRRRDKPVRSAGTVGLRPSGSPRPIDYADLLAAVQQPTIGYDQVFWRSGAKLASAASAIADRWLHLQRHAQGEGLEQVSLREHVAMAASARWAVAAAAARTESRGIHERIDHPGSDPAMARRLLVGGLDDVWVRFEDAAQSPLSVEHAA